MKCICVWFLICFSLLAAGMFLRGQEWKGWMITGFLVWLIVGLIVYATRRE
jgi:hypothetical protein